MRKVTLVITLLLSLILQVQAQTFNYDKIAPHPRLLLPAGQEEAIKQAMKQYPPLQQVHQQILKRCEDALIAPTLVFKKDGKRLLAVSREALTRIFYLSYAYRMTGNKVYAIRAEQEMVAVSKFHSWNPSHYLDVGEMVMALAIGYDWLYKDLRPSTRELVRKAIIELGFNTAEGQWFYNAKNNWNQVCNGGLSYGAMAIYEDEPAIAKAVLEKSVKSNPPSMEVYGPDGGYPEGFMYWGYGTGFEVMYIAALQTAFGTDAGLTQIPGFLQSARFIQFMTGPSGECFDFCDSTLSPICNPMLFWFAKQLNDPSIVWLEKGYLEAGTKAFSEPRLLPALMIFASQIDMSNLPKPTQNFWQNRGITPTFIYRSGWESTKDSYLGIKGGTCSSSHAHMDEGSFVYEKNGVRWAIDLGMQSYITLESRGVDLWNMSQEGQRWDVFRIGSTAHNTLTINGHRHLVKGMVNFTETWKTPSRKGAALDMTSVLSNDLKQATRKVWLDKKDDLHVVDVLTANGETAEVLWNMTTRAQARITGKNTIELSQNGHRMLLTVSCNAPFEMKTWTTEPVHDYDAPNPGSSRVGFIANLKPNQKATLQVTVKAID